MNYNEQKMHIWAVLWTKVTNYSKNSEYLYKNAYKYSKLKNTCKKILKTCKKILDNAEKGVYNTNIKNNNTS